MWKFLSPKQSHEETEGKGFPDRKTTEQDLTASVLERAHPLRGPGAFLVPRRISQSFL